MREEVNPRPWTVYALVLLVVGGMVLSQIVDAHRDLWDLVAIATSLFIAWGFWTGKQWAFSMMFMLVSLCTGLAVVIALVGAFLMEAGLNVPLLWTGLAGVVWMVLLLRPETKRFAGFDRLPQRAPVAR